MNPSTSPIGRQQLLIEANALMKEHDDYLQGIAVTDVEQNANLLIFKGEYFLDEQGLPTRKTTAVFNLFKYLTQSLSEKYHLVDE